MSTDTVPKGVALPLETWIEELGLFEVLRREWKIKEVTEKAGKIKIIDTNQDTAVVQFEGGRQRTVKYAALIWSV